MRVKLAKSAGYCLGVRRAMEIVLSAANRGKGPIYTYGPLIHNPQTIQFLTQRNVHIAKDFSDISGGTIVIRTHGVSPEIRHKLKATKAEICDATCPRVARVQAIIKRYADRGYSIIIVGDPGHAEVIGLLGFSYNGGIVIDSLEDVETIPPLDKVCVVSQTTQSEDRFKEISNKIRLKFQNCLIFNTICNSTSKRQKEVISLSGNVDAMVIVGGKNSANTARLAEIARSTGIPTFHIETDEEIDTNRLKCLKTIGITAGASTPNWLIQRVVAKVEAIGEQSRRGWLQSLRRLMHFSIKGNLYVALGASCLSYASCRLQGIEPKLAVLFIAAAYVFSMHILNHFTDRAAVSLNEPGRTTFYNQHKRFLITLGVGSILTALVLSIALGWWPFIFLLCISTLGAIYQMNIVPQRWSSGLKYRRLKDIPASKDIFLALAWALVTVVLHLLNAGGRPYPAAIVAFAFTFGLVFIRSTLFSLRDVQGDQILGHETIPVIIGKEKTKVILLALCALLSLLLTFSARRGWTSPLSYYLLIPIIYTCAYLYLYHRRFIFQGLIFEAVVDGKFILTGAVAYLWHSLLT